MEWMNIHIAKQLRSPACVGSSPSELGTWILCLGYCCEQENGGRITGAAKWKDRQLQRAIGVTLAEVRSSDRLLTIEGDDILVNGYPETKVANVQRLRGQSQAAALRRWGKRDGQCQEVVPQGMPYGITHGMPKGNAEGEGEGEGEVENRNNIDAAGSAWEHPGERPAQPAAAMTRSWMDWKLTIGRHRVYLDREGNSETHWAELYSRAGWDEFTKAWEYCAKKAKDGKGKIFLSNMLEVLS